MIGETLAHFKITDKLGEGGMGEVYRAEDTKLGREVAIKVLPETVANDPERLARFDREAKVLASLNHPNIAAIYSFESAERTDPTVGAPLAGAREGASPSPTSDESDVSRQDPRPRTQVPGPAIHFLVMELVEGETLAERIKRGRLPLDEAMTIALQIAEALETAHDRGIVHRDLKPANINFTESGKIKVLDFGLAKALESGAGTDSDPSHPSLSLSPTLTAQMNTGAGVLLGTAAYMSPEQARGEAVDRRADIWALGAVVMEMLTGQTVYAGKTVSDTLAGILAREPEWEALPDDVPPVIQNLLDRCLQKEIGDRLQAVGEARIAVAGYLADPEAAKAQAVATEYTPLPAWRRALPWAALALAAIAAAAAVVGWTRSPAVSKSETLRLNVEMPVEDTLLTQIGSSIVVSPDGKHMAYVTGNPATRSLHLRSLDQLEGRMVSGGDLAYLPFFSPDAEWIAFVTPNELKKVSVSGGTPLTIATVDFCRGATWTPDDHIIFTPEEQAPLFRIPAAGGEPEQLTTLDEEKGEITHRWPHVLPNGNAVLFVSHTENARFAEATIEALDLETGERRVLVQGGTYPRWADSGHLLYAREGTLYAVPMDPVTLELQGSPGPVIEALTTNEGAYGTAHYSVSDTGTLVYMQGAASAAAYDAVRVDLDGLVSPLLDDAGTYWTPAFSPDGRRLAIDIAAESGNGDIWVEDLDRGIRTRLTFDESDDTGPVWSPDGEWIYFQSDRGNSYDIFRVAADGSEQPVRLTETDSDQAPSDVTPDGKTLIFGQINPESSWDIMTMPIDGDGEPEVFLSTTFLEYGGRVSPDGNWITYGSNESGGFEVYVRPFPAGRGEWQISSSGQRATYPTWASDQTQIFFRTAVGMASASVDSAGGTFRAKRPGTLFESRFIDLFPNQDYDIAPGSEYLVMFQGSNSADTIDHVVLVTNWFDELDQLFTTAR
jgi:serine/threonine-protein kinase